MTYECLWLNRYNRIESYFPSWPCFFSSSSDGRIYCAIGCDFVLLNNKIGSELCKTRPIVYFVKCNFIVLAYGIKSNVLKFECVITCSVDRSHMVWSVFFCVCIDPDYREAAYRIVRLNIAAFHHQTKSLHLSHSLPPTHAHTRASPNP